MFEMMLGSGKAQSSDPSMFIREVPSSEFITGDALATAIGLTAGISQNSDSGWLLFEDEGKTKYISKKPIRHTVSWDHLQAKGAVFGTTTVVIQGKTYKVRLLSGANTNPSTAVYGSFDHPGTHGCEWNRLLYHISAKPFRAGASNILTSEGIVEGDWASYAEADIGMALAYLSGAARYGAFQWCQETGTTGTQRVARGGNGVSYLGQYGASGLTTNYGWRPVLELV